MLLFPLMVVISIIISKKSFFLVEKFILDSYKEGIKNILVITGKGSRSNVEEDTYRSSKMNVLKKQFPKI